MDTYIALLGPVSVKTDNTSFHLRSAQARVAFARLTLAHHEGVTRDELADVVWPNSLPPTWASALRTLVSRLRAFASSFVPDVANPLVVRSGHYVLQRDDHVVVDIEEARRSIMVAQDALTAGEFAIAHDLGGQAAETLRAPLLSDCEGSWVMNLRDRLAEFLVTGLEIASQAAVSLGNHQRAVLLADEATARAPVRESAYRCVMAALAALGNRGEALRAYQRLRRLLAEELGVDPSPETEAAYLDLLGPTTSVRREQSSEHAASQLRRVAPFVNRQHELSLLGDAWDRASGGGPRQLVFVTGEVGIGKTRLVQEAGKRMAADGGLLLLGRCEEGTAVAYQPFVEAIDGYLAASPDEPLRDLSPDARATLSRVLPSRGGPCPAADIPDQARLFWALTDLLLLAARERPLALLLDDLHWADGGTIQLLKHVLRHSRQARLCVVAMARDDLAIPVALQEIVHRLEHEGEASSVRLTGIDVYATKQLVETVMPAMAGSRHRYARFLHSQTAGNPFMLLEFLRAKVGAQPGARAQGDERVPAGIASLVATKQAALGDDTKRLLEVAAVAGTPFEFDRAVATAGLDESAALDAVERALRAGILTELTTAHTEVRGRAALYGFRHEAVRRVVHDQLSRARRFRLQERPCTAARN